MNSNRGPGRPPAHPRMRKEQYSTRLPQWLIEGIQAISSARDIPQARLIELAILKTYNLKPPR